jgi:hypothetical protein
MASLDSTEFLYTRRISGLIYTLIYKTIYKNALTGVLDGENCHARALPTMVRADPSISVSPSGSEGSSNRHRGDGVDRHT